MAGEIIPLTRAALEQDVRQHALDGRASSNRCRTRVNQLGVDHDVAAVFAWIHDRAASPKTKRVFLAEARRLFWWAWRRARKPLSSLTRDDFVIYREFLLDPGKDAIGSQKVPFLKDGVLNPAWRPFIIKIRDGKPEGKLSEAHVEHVFAVLKSLFKYLVDMGYLDGNPLAGMRARAKASMGDHSRRQSDPTERALDEEQWHAVIEAIEELPKETPGQRNYYERVRFMMRLFYLLGARIGELASHRMQDFKLRKTRWVWSVMGKGGKEEDVPVNQELLEALKRYRRHLGLPPLPVAGEDLPLLLNKTGARRIGDRQAFRIVKEVFALGAARLTASHPDKAEQLKNASPHWIRHATATYLARRAKTIKDLIGVQRIMRHTKLKTTLEYTHLSDDDTETTVEGLSAIPQKRD